MKVENIFKDTFNSFKDIITRKSFWKKMLITLPILLLILTLWISKMFVTKYEDGVYQRAFTEKVLSTQIFCDGFDVLIDEGLSWEDNKKTYGRRLLTYVQTQDSLHSVNAILVNNQGEQVSRRAHKEHGYCNPFENEKNVEIIKNIIDSQVKSQQFVLRCGDCNSEECDWYIQAVPMRETLYYVMIGVNENTIKADTDTSLFNLFTFIVGLLLIISVEDSVYQRMKNGN